MKKLHLILVVIVAIAAILGGVYRFDHCKVAKAEYENYVAATDNFKFESYRRYLQERIWAMKRNYPNRYSQMPEYSRLVEELRQLDLKINAYYNRRGR